MRKFIDIISESVKLYTREELEALDIDELDRMAYGLVGDQVIELSPEDIEIKWHDDLANPEYKFKLGGMDWVRSVTFEEPVEVSVAQDGKLYLEDGHHRWFAAKKLGISLHAKIEIKGKPIERILDLQKQGFPLHYYE